MKLRCDELLITFASKLGTLHKTHIKFAYNNTRTCNALFMLPLHELKSIVKAFIYTAHKDKLWHFIITEIQALNLF